MDSAAAAGATEDAGTAAEAGADSDRSRRRLLRGGRRGAHRRVIVAHPATASGLPTAVRRRRWAVNRGTYCAAGLRPTNRPFPAEELRLCDRADDEESAESLVSAKAVGMSATP